MKTLNLAVIAACSLALAAPFVPVLAQAPPMGGPMHGPMGGMRGGGGGRMRMMADQLGLTDAQKAKMQPILMGSRQQMMALRSNTTLAPAARMAKMQSMRKTMMTQMMAILTPAQRTKFKAMQQQQRQAGGGQYGGGQYSHMPHP